MFLSWIKNCFYQHCLYRKENKSIQFNSTASCSHLVLIITLIFVWILSVKDVTWICFCRTFCNIFLDISGFWDGIWYIFVFDLICLFQWIVLISYVVSTGSSSQLVFIINLIGVWMTLSTTDDVWMTSSAIDDVIRKECHGKHVLPLWSPRSKWPIQEISLISLTFGNFLPGNWPCRWHSCLIYLLRRPHVVCLPSAHVQMTSSACRPHAVCMRADDVVRTQQAIQSNHLVPSFQNGSFESKSRSSSAKNQASKSKSFLWSLPLSTAITKVE